MINYKEEYKKQNRFLTGITIILAITLILYLIESREITEKMNKKDEKIWKLESEIVELKEQIHILEMKEE